MRNLASRTRFGVLLVGLVGAMLAAAASADVKVVVHGPGSLWNYRMKYELPCGTTEIRQARNDLVCGVEAPWILKAGFESPGLPRVIITAYCNDGVAYSSAYAFAGACAGGANTTQALPNDTLSASVGLYPPGGLFPSNPSTPDTTLMMRFAVIRTTGNVRLVNLGGGLQTSNDQLANSHISTADFRLAVYPNQAAADADSFNITGGGSAFIGRATLVGAPGSIVAQQGFSSGDWVLQNNGGGRFTATMTPGYTKDVPVANSTDAVVVLFGDPKSGPTPPVATPTPGHSPVGLALLTLALLGGGIWVIRSRRTMRAA